MSNLKAKISTKAFVSVAMIIAIVVSVLISSIISSIGDRSNMKKVLQKTGYLEDVQSTIEEKLGEATESYLNENGIIDVSKMTDKQVSELSSIIVDSIIEDYGDLDEDEKALLGEAVTDAIIKRTTEDEVVNNIIGRGIKSGDSVDKSTVNDIVNEVTKVVANKVGNTTNEEIIKSIAQSVINEYITNESIVNNNAYQTDKSASAATVESIKNEVMESMRDIETLRGAYDALLESSTKYQKSADSEIEALYEKIDSFQAAQKTTDGTQDENSKEMYDDMLSQMEKMSKTFTSYQSEQEQIIDIINETLDKKADYGVSNAATTELAQAQAESIAESLEKATQAVDDLKEIETRLKDEDGNGYFKDAIDAIELAQQVADILKEKDPDSITEDDINDYTDKVTDVEGAVGDLNAELEKLKTKQEAVLSYINIAQSNVEALAASLASNSEALTAEEIQALNDKIAELNAKITAAKSYSNEIADIRVGLTELQNTNTGIKSNIQTAIDEGSDLDDLMSAIESIGRRLEALSNEETEVARAAGEGDAAIESAKNKLSGSNQSITDAISIAEGLEELQLSGNVTVVEAVQKLYKLIRANDSKIQYNNGLITDLQEEMAYVKAWETRIETLEDQVNILSSTYATSSDLITLRDQIQNDFEVYRGATADKMAEVIEIDKQLNRRIDAIKESIDNIKKNIEELSSRDFFIGPFSVTSDSFRIEDEHITALSDIMIDYDLNSLPPTSIGFTYDQGDGYIVIHGANGAYIKTIHIENDVALTEWDTEIPDYEVTYNDSSSSSDDGDAADPGEPSDPDDPDDTDDTDDTEDTDPDDSTSGSDDNDTDGSDDSENSTADPDTGTGD